MLDRGGTGSAGLTSCRSRMPRVTPTCAYCGRGSPKTVDHVPPRGIFPYPLPSDLITVPCCLACRADTSVDDQHFRDVLLSAAELEHERAAKARERVTRSLARPEQERYSTTFLRSMVDIDIYSEGGIWLDRQPGIPLSPRIGKVVERIARGLYWRRPAAAGDARSREGSPGPARAQPSPGRRPRRPRAAAGLGVQRPVRVQQVAGSASICAALRRMVFRRTIIFLQESQRHWMN